MKRLLLTALALVATASLADAGPIQRLRCRVQARPMVRYYTAPVKQVAANVAAVVQSRPVISAFRVCGPGGCK